MSGDCGPWVRLWGVEHSQLPSADAKGEDLKAFLSSILKEALLFINGVSEQSSKGNSSWKRTSVKTFPHSSGPVHLHERTAAAVDLRAVAEKHHPPGIDVSHIRPETWALRQSIHENSATKGSASWSEFVRCFKDKHAEAELAFTSSIVSTKLHHEWDCAGVEVEVGDTTWTSFTLKREESVHQLPPPLAKRLFPVLQVTAMARGRHEFLVVQIATRPGQGDKDEHGGLVRAAYTSIETVKEMADGAKIEWIMGTASTAGGVLPMWVQRMAIPAQIAKDVDMFMKWIAQEREKKDSEILGGAVEETDGMTTVEI